MTEEALVFAAHMLELDLTAEKRGQLMQARLQIKAWPDALPALKSLKDISIRLAFLSNLTAPMIDAAVGNSGLEGIFEPHLSTDRVRAFKPDPRAGRIADLPFGLAVLHDRAGVTAGAKPTPDHPVALLLKKISAWHVEW